VVRPRSNPVALHNNRSDRHHRYNKEDMKSNRDTPSTRARHMVGRV